MSAQGAFTFVLNGHLPYTRLPGPFGDIGTHEVLAETYIPLLQTLYDLKDAGVSYTLTLSLSPLLLEQLIDPETRTNFDQYLEEKTQAARQDRSQYARDKSGHLYYLSGWYAQWYERLRAAFNDRFHRDLAGAFRRLQDEGHLEIITSAATYAYLPLIQHDSALRGQIKTAVRSYRRIFERQPTGIWLPGAGYRPGLEQILADEGIKVLITEPHLIAGGQPVGVAAGDVIGPYHAIKQIYALPLGQLRPVSPLNIHQPYYIGSTDVAAVVRDDRSTMQVWGALLGYPGDVDYRDFHRIASTSGLNYWRVTGMQVDPHDKDFYHPDWATYKVEQHAEHFAHLVGDMIRQEYQETGQIGLIATVLDVQLIGHWWFEGAAWLGRVLRHLATTAAIELTTVSRFVTDHAPAASVSLTEGSWGVGGDHFVWDNPMTHWLWEIAHQAEARMAALAARFAQPDDDTRAVLNQAARELLLLESSDWALQITTRQDRQHAIQRFYRHLERFDRLAASLENGQPDRALADAFQVVDHVFSDVDYRFFAGS